MHVTADGSVVGSVDRARLEAMQKEPEAAPPEAEFELDMLRAQAEQLGVKVDGRWGADRLRQEISDEQEND